MQLDTPEVAEALELLRAMTKTFCDTVSVFGAVGGYITAIVDHLYRLKEPLSQPSPETSMYVSISGSTRSADLHECLLLITKCVEVVARSKWLRKLEEGRALILEMMKSLADGSRETSGTHGASEDEESNFPAACNHVFEKLGSMIKLLPSIETQRVPLLRCLESVVLVAVEAKTFGQTIEPVMGHARGSRGEREDISVQLSRLCKQALEWDWRANFISICPA